jgi:hypothetical protein
VKRWAYAPIDTFCGSCGATVPQGKPYLEVRITNVKPRYRCETCAGEPPNLEQLEADAVRLAARVVEPPSFVQVKYIAPKDLPFDPRMAQTGERDEA